MSNLESRLESIKKLKEYANSLIGLNYKETIPELEALDIEFRVVNIEGQPCMCTADVRMERLNFTIENGIIIKVKFG